MCLWLLEGGERERERGRERDIKVREKQSIGYFPYMPQTGD